jgi:cephalosporin-C deacetylase-like acetyl esterase
VDAAADALRRFQQQRPSPALGHARSEHHAADTAADDDVYPAADDVSFAGWNGERVRAWLTLPRGVDCGAIVGRATPQAIRACGL